VILNPIRSKRDIVVIGGSAGALQALMTMLDKLPENFPGVIAIVVHRHPVLSSKLQVVLGRHCPLPVTEVEERQVFQGGRVYLAPRDRHLRFDDGRFDARRDVPEHRFRPAIDPLFVSAANEYNSRVVGVLLSGGGEDGIAGLIAIKAAGGLSLVQDPSDAVTPVLPLNAIRKDDVDMVLKAADLALALEGLATGKAVEIDGSR